MAGPAIKMEIKGLTELRKALKQSPELTAKEIHSAIVQSIAGIRREVLPRTPYKTGMLRQSLTRGIEIKPLSGSIGSDLIYAWPQHEGNFFHPKGGEKHYLLNATKAQINNITKLFEKAVKNVISTIASKSK